MIACMKNSSCLRAAALVLLSAALAGCLSNISLTDSWQSPTLERKDLTNVLVVAMAPNITNRTLFERGFQQALQDQGIRATVSYEVLGDELPTRERVTAYVKANGMSHVILTQYGGETVAREVVPESVRTYYTGPYYPTYGSYWDYHGSTITLTRESYVEENRTVMLTTSIFDVQTEALVWAGRSKAFDVDSIAYGANDLARLVIAGVKN
jgi:hypothetical protein